MNSNAFVTLIIATFLASRLLAATVSTSLPIDSVTTDRQSREIREAILNLADQSTRAELAIAKLRREPRHLVLGIIAEQITDNPQHPSSLGLKAAAALRAVELLGQIEKLMEKNDSWQLIDAAKQIAARASPEVKVHWSQYFKQRLETDLPDMSQIATIDALTEFRVALSQVRFQTALGHENFQVRIAAVRNFLILRATLNAAEQSERFRLAFFLKPYQARLPAMQNFAQLPERTRRELGRALAKTIEGLHCENEERGEVRSACEEVVRAVK